MTNVRDFGATGDGTTDDTDAILHAVRDGGGSIEFGRGVYRISRTLELALDTINRTGINGSDGTATLIMAGAGPAIRLIGTHGGTAAPASFEPNVWLRQRMPQIHNIAIEGDHPEADGIELVGTMQAVVSGIMLRQLRHGIRLNQRNRNVLITDCQIFHNTGVGVLCGGVNLHQFNIIGNHISYCRLGGIRIQGSEIRNLQITGNDIEYNNFRSHDGAPFDEPTAEILIDSRGAETDDPRPSVREFTIASNTIQATWSENGANIRVIGPDPTGLLFPGNGAITGNLIGNQAINIHLTGIRGLALSGNMLYGGYQHNLLIEQSDDIAIAANTFGHNYWVASREIDNNISLIDCTDCVLNGIEIRGAPSGRTNWTEDWEGGEARVHPALIEITRCKRINLTGCLLRDPSPVGVKLIDSSHVNVSGCQIHDTRSEPQMQHALHWTGQGLGNLMTGNIVSRGLAEPIRIDDGVAVQRANDLEV